MRTLSVVETAKRIGVSSSTIRNWLRSGGLQRATNGEVSLDSIERCEREQLGYSKLVSRANKRSKQVKSMAVKNISRYDESLGEVHRNSDGVYYTPQAVARDMFSSVVGEKSGDDLSDKLLLDPCCGSGNFLVEALDMGFRPENIFGYDIDPKAVRIARRRIYELTGVRTRNIVCGDFLKIAARARRRYDYVVTNPPWGKKMSMAERRELAKMYGMGQSADSSSIFLVASMGLLRDGGGLSFLVQEALFSVRSHELVRRYVFDYEITSLVDYGRVFPSLLTNAFAITLTKTESVDESQILCEVDGRRYLRDRYSFECNPYLIFNIWATSAEAAVVRRLFEMEHITLRGQAQWGLGVVTGANDRHLSREPRDGYIAVIRGADIEPESDSSYGRGRVRKPSLYMNSDMSNYQQVAPLSLYLHPEKLIYRFISDRLCFAVDRERLITINSANVLIPNTDFPLSADQLAKLLNSDFMNWLFRALFRTRKVLRGDLEWLPIYPDYFVQNKEFDEKEYLKWLNVEIND